MSKDVNNNDIIDKKYDKGNYHDEINKKNIIHLRELLDSLPSFCGQYFRGMQEYISTRTRIAYAYDIRVFFEYLHDKNPLFAKQPIKEYSIEILDQITKLDIEEYLEYCTLYEKDGKAYMNDEKGKKRKLASLRSFYNYFYRNEMIEKNPASLVPLPKLHNKEIVRLDADEVAILLDTVESGEKLTKKQLCYHEKTKTRDVALLTLLLGTGMRVSECVGIDLTDIDFRNNGIKIRRKGGNEAVIYFGDEVETALLDYLELRHMIIPCSGSENALFLSMQKKRISVRAVENLVKKYSSLITNIKNITPHKLRSTYGTALYRETGDIYLVADVLGHSDVNTTRKHYAAVEEDRRRKAAKMVNLREK